MKKRKKLRCQCPNDITHPISDWYGQYDSFACLVCDIWTDSVCSCEQNNCEFKLADRPKRPSDVKDKNHV